MRGGKCKLYEMQYYRTTGKMVGWNISTHIRDAMVGTFQHRDPRVPIRDRGALRETETLKVEG